MLTRWNPLGFVDFDRSFPGFGGVAGTGALRRELDRLLEGWERGYGPDADPRPVAGRPRFILRDAGKELRLRAELPGLSAAELELSLEAGSLTLRGERKVATPQGYAAHRQERSTYSFAQSFSLPCRVDGEKVVAKLAHGILEVTLPKVAEEQPRQIAIRAA